jgi:uncharacterized protein YhbP (UPF0306 family)
MMIKERYGHRTNHQRLSTAGHSPVAGNIVKQHGLGEYPVGVYFEGSAKPLEARDEQNKAFEAIKTRFGVGDEILEDAKRTDGHKFYKITVDMFYVFGKAAVIT